MPKYCVKATNMIFSPDGKFLLACDYSNYCIRSICLKSGQISVFVGIPGKQGSRNGPKEQALIDCPRSLTFSRDGTRLLFCEPRTHCIRTICVKSGKVSTFAGILGERGLKNGLKEQALFNFPSSITFSQDGTYILVCDLLNNSLRKIHLKNCKVSCAKFGYEQPMDITLSLDGTYVLVSCSNYIRKIFLNSRQISTFAGIMDQKGSRNGLKEQALFTKLSNILITHNGKNILFCCNNNIKYIKIRN
jgi:sugar lactone lactonase YvrE